MNIVEKNMNKINHLRGIICGIEKYLLDDFNLTS